MFVVFMPSGSFGWEVSVENKKKKLTKYDQIEDFVLSRTSWWPLSQSQSLKPLKNGGWKRILSYWEGNSSKRTVKLQGGIWLKPLLKRVRRERGFGTVFQIPTINFGCPQFWATANCAVLLYCCMTLIIQWTKFQQHFKKFDLGNVR